MRKTALNTVHDLAKTDPRVVFIGSDLGAGVLDDMKQGLPDRFFMEGIAEQHVIGMAAGLAMEGFIPFINTIATFMTRRCLEQVAVDLCLHRLPVRLIASGGGVVYAPLGPTHLAIEDIALMRALPNMTVVAPSDAEEMRRVITAAIDWPDPMYVRFGKGGDPVVSDAAHGFTLGKGIVLKAPGRVLLVSTGVMTARSLDAARLLDADGLSAGVLHLHTIKPLDDALLARLAGTVDLVVTVEEHVRSGGLGSAVVESLVDAQAAGTLERLPRVVRMALPDAFPKCYGSQASQLAAAGLEPPDIVRSTRQGLEAAKGKSAVEPVA